MDVPHECEAASTIPSTTAAASAPATSIPTIGIALMLSYLSSKPSSPLLLGDTEIRCSRGEARRGRSRALRKPLGPHGWELRGAERGVRGGAALTHRQRLQMKVEPADRSGVQHDSAGEARAPEADPARVDLRAGLQVADRVAEVLSVGQRE